MAAATAPHFVACQSLIVNSVESQSSGAVLFSKNGSSSIAPCLRGRIASYQGLRSTGITDLGRLRSRTEATFKQALKKALSVGHKGPKGVVVWCTSLGEDVVFIANDWHTALLPCYLKSIYKPAGFFTSAKVAFCIHNIAYQGRFAFSDFSLLNLPQQFKSSFDFIDGYLKPVKGRKINWMKAGILESDRVLTVSPYYANELISGEDRGVELESIIRRTGITGIVNGMDVQEWDPSSDKYIDVIYDATTVGEAKPALKEALQAEVGLPVDPDIPIIGFIGRLEEQKGSDILTKAVSKFLDENV